LSPNSEKCLFINIPSSPLKNIPTQLSIPSEFALLDIGKDTFQNLRDAPVDALAQESASGTTGPLEHGYSVAVTKSKSKI